MSVGIDEIETALQTNMRRDGQRCIHAGIDVSPERTVGHTLHFAIDIEGLPAKWKYTESSARYR